MLTNLFISRGWSRDDLKWFWLQIVAVAGLVSSNVFDVPYWMAYLGIPLSPKALHWIFALVALVLWIAGKYDASSLPSKQAMVSGSVSNSPAAKIGAVILAVVLGGAMLGAAVFTSACASAPPAGTYSPVVTKAYNADQLVKDLIALGQTARNLNAVSGQEHLTDRDTAYIRDGSLIAGAGLYAYGQGATTLLTAKAALDTLPPGYLPAQYLTPARAAFDQAIIDHGAGASALYVVVDVYKTLRKNISVSATTNPKLTLVLGAVDAGIAAIPLQ